MVLFHRRNRSKESSSIAIMLSLCLGVLSPILLVLASSSSSSCQCEAFTTSSKLLLLHTTQQRPSSFTTRTTASPRLVASSSSTRQQQQQHPWVLKYGAADYYDEDDDDDDDDDDILIDPDSLGDWRMFRRNLASSSSLDDSRTTTTTTTTTTDPVSAAGTTTAQPTPPSPTTTTKKTIRSISKENQEVVLSQNEKLGQEYMSDVWAHETATPELGGLLVRLPLEVELYRNYRHSLIGKKLRKLLTHDDDDDDNEFNNEMRSVSTSTWFTRASNLVKDEMQKIFDAADEQGQIEATNLKDESVEMLSLYLDNQETWQEVCLLLEKDYDNDSYSNDDGDGDGGGTSKAVVLNRPMAMKLTENLGKLVLYGAFQTSGKSSSSSSSSSSTALSGTQDTSEMSSVARKDWMKFMLAFGKECAIYVGGPDGQDQPAIMIHGVPNLPGAIEISPGSKIYQGGIDAAIDGVLEGKYNPLEFRFFVGCHDHEDYAIDIAVHLGKYQPIACARSVALKQCISLPKPLWHEVMELCGGEMADLSNLELSKHDDLKFQVLDDDDYDEYNDEDDTDDDDDDDDDDDIPDELSELDNFDDEEDEYY